MPDLEINNRCRFYEGARQRRNTSITNSRSLVRKRINGTTDTKRTCAIVSKTETIRTDDTLSVRILSVSCRFYSGHETGRIRTWNGHDPVRFMSVSSRFLKKKRYICPFCDRHPARGLGAYSARGTSARLRTTPEPTLYQENRAGLRWDNPQQHLKEQYNRF